jgi:hypothetical protein
LIFPSGSIIGIKAPRGDAITSLIHGGVELRVRRTFGHERALEQVGHYAFEDDHLYVTFRVVDSNDPEFGATTGFSEAALKKLANEARIEGAGIVAKEPGADTVKDASAGIEDELNTVEDSIQFWRENGVDVSLPKFEIPWFAIGASLVAAAAVGALILRSRK